jgi:hypothetical protein
MSQEKTTTGIAPQAKNNVEILPKHKVTMPELIAKCADMESDIVVAIDVIGKLLISLGITKDMQAGRDFSAALPKIMGRLTIQFASGDFDTTAFADLSQILPLLDKYSHLERK